MLWYHAKHHLPHAWHDSGKEARKQLEAIKNSDVVMRFLLEKQITLKRMGAGVLLKDQMSVGQWYLSKLLFAFSFGLCSFFMLQEIGRAHV